MTQKGHHFKYLAGAIDYAKRYGYKVWKESYLDGVVRYYVGKEPSPTALSKADIETVYSKDIPYKNSSDDRFCEPEVTIEEVPISKQ